MPRATRQKPWLLAPVDLQAVKACGVTYVRSMLERVIEERCRGDASQAEAVRAEVRAHHRRRPRGVRPGSAEATRLKAALVQKGWWSQYLEVGIGPDAEIFSKCQPMASVGPGALIGVHPISQWSNPEPEAVLAVNARGTILGAMLGNDVNLRDVEGRSALLLGRAKDNNASCALGPVLRLFDAGFALEDVRGAEIALSIEGTDGFRLEEPGAIGAISRELTRHRRPADRRRTTNIRTARCCSSARPSRRSRTAARRARASPTSRATSCGIATPRLGALVNEVARTDACPPWTFGTGALFANLAQRGLPRR